MNCWVLNVGFSGPEAAKGEIRRPFLERERERLYTVLERELERKEVIE